MDEPRKQTRGLLMMSEGHEGNCSNDAVETTAQAALQFVRHTGAMAGEAGIFKTD